MTSAKIWLWTQVAEFATWLLAVAVDHGAYEGVVLDEDTEAATLEACERDQAIYDRGLGAGYLEGRNDARRETGARMQ